MGLTGQARTSRGDPLRDLRAAAAGHLAPLDASKHGLIGLTRNIAATYAKEGIRCVAVCPGGVDTGIALGGDPSPRGYAALEKTLATNIRMAEPREIASVIAFLASDQASFLRDYPLKAGTLSLTLTGT